MEFYLKMRVHGANINMFTIYQDYIIKQSDVPVLTHQSHGQFEPTDCYFLEFFITADDETIKKIKTLCAPFGFSAGIPQKIAAHDSESGNIQRLFLLAGPDIIRNKFTNPDDCLAFSLCDDGPKSTEIQYFEVNYIFKHSFDPNQKYRRVGTSALDALKTVYQTRELCGESALDALKFWIKNDFTHIDGQKELRLHWRQR